MATMRAFFQLAPPPLLQLIIAILLAPRPAVASPATPISARAGFSFDQLFGRGVCDTGITCGYSSQLCCSVGSACWTDSNTQAQCSATAAATGGYWEQYTTTYTETDLALVTSVMSTYIAPATATPVCTAALNETPCGSICCASGQYCSNPSASICLAAGDGGSSAFYSTTYYTTTYSTPGATAGAPIVPTVSSGVVITSTQSPTVTVPFSAPIATGANVTLTSEQSTSGGGGLSGGAIAGIVIGVLLALFLLGLICFCCCVKGLLDGLFGILGIGRKHKRTTEVDEYERRSHHTSGGGAAGGGRRWYGAAAPSRVSRRDERKESSHEGRNLLGVGAGLAALWAILGLKRRRQERKNEEKYSEYSYGSDYYTSESEFSSRSRPPRTEHN